MTEHEGPRPGLVGRVTVTVTDADTAVALGSGDVRVLGTPRVVALLEEAACVALQGSLPADRTTVGAHIDLSHLAPSPVGATVEATATVTEIDRSRLRFDLVATMDGEPIANGTHLRVMVPRGFGEG